MLESNDNQSEARVYRLRWWAQGTFILGSVVCAVIGSLTLFGSTPDTLDPVKQAPINTILGVGLIFLAAYIAARAVFSAVIVDQDTITARGVFQSRSLRKSEVRGFEEYSSGKGLTYLILWPKSPEQRHLQFENYFSFDGEWKRWISTLPDIGKEDEARFTLK